MYEKAILRAADVCSLLNVSQPTLYRWIRNERFPKGFRYGPNTVGWDRATVDAWVTAKKLTAAPSAC